MKLITDITSESIEEHAPHKKVDNRLILVLSMIICLVIGIVLATLLVAPLYIALTDRHSVKILIAYPVYIILYPLLKKIKAATAEALYWYTF